MNAPRTSRLLPPLGLPALLLLALPAPGQDKSDPYAGHIAVTAPRKPEEERALLRVPPGFEVQLVAAEPDIYKPMNLAFDARGRLWVTDTLEYPFPAQDGKGRDTVKVLEDFGPDGRARKVTTFAGGLNIPIGVLPLTPAGDEASALVFSIPHVLRLTDADGDGKADKREVLYEKYGYQDTHGMTSGFTAGFDGWVYACHGYANTSSVKGADGAAVTMQSGNTYRLRPDGSRLEQHTWGQVNPFGLALDPLGHLYSADCHSQPIYQLLRGAYYPSFGKPHDGLGFGPEMIADFKGSTAICGIAHYAAGHFPEAHRGTAYVGDVVANRVFQFRLEWQGTSPKAIPQDFVVSGDPWFRPVDIKLGPDGALYVADFYNRVIGHYEVPLTHPGRDRDRGRIWRVVYRGPDGKAAPPAPPKDRTKASGEDLVRDLSDPNLTVRLQATELLARRGGAASDSALRELLKPASDPWGRAHALWALERRGALDDAALGTALHDAAAPVRVHALHILAERRTPAPALRGEAVARLKDADPFVRRAAAEALGRHPDAANLRPLLDLRHGVSPADTHLLHVARMALRDTLRPGTAWKHVAAESKTAADARALADVAAGVPSPEAASYLLAHIRQQDEPAERLADYVRHVGRYGTAEARGGLVAFVRAHRPDDRLRRAALWRSGLQGMQEGGAAPGEEAAASAAELAARLIASDGDAEMSAGVELASALKARSLAEPLARLGRNRSAAEAARSAALSALANVNAQAAAALLGDVLTDADAPFGLREHAARTLAGLNNSEGFARLAAAMPSVPARVQTVIALALTGSPRGMRTLLDAVEAGKASPRLLLEPAVARWLAVPRNAFAADRVAKLTRGLPPADQRVDELLARRRAAFVAARADAGAGAAVFEKHCGNCHQVSGKGAKIGPQLDGIGARGLDRLLEDLLDPNRNVDQAFRLTTLNLKSGQVASGLLLREEGEVLVLADAQGKDVRVPKAAVDDRAVSPLSPMPANLMDQIPEGDFYQLVAFLLAQRPTGDEKGRTFSFAKESLGKVPAGWTAGHTGTGGGGAWKVVADAAAPSKTGHALAQTGESPGPVFNLCVADETSFTDPEASVMFKSNKGKRDQGGGLVWRYTDANNYYIARYNPLEVNYRLYKVVAGKRVQLATKEDLTVTEGAWHKLTIRMVGDQIECHLNGKKILEAKDDTFRKAGKVGLWTKADAQTSFDQFVTVEIKK